MTTPKRKVMTPDDLDYYVAEMGLLEDYEVRKEQCRNLYSAYQELREAAREYVLSEIDIEEKKDLDKNATRWNRRADAFKSLTKLVAEED